MVDQNSAPIADMFTGLAASVRQEGVYIRHKDGMESYLPWAVLETAMRALGYATSLDGSIPGIVPDVFSCGAKSHFGTTACMLLIIRGETEKRS